MEIFVSAIFIMLQKNAFGQKKFKFHARVQKCHFGKIEKLPEIEIFFGQKHCFEAI
jgi:hypothetical protein